MSNKNNVIEMPEAEKPESIEEEVQKLSPEEIEKMREQSEKEIEEARLSHLKAAVVNKYAIRDQFQQAIIMSIIERPTKTKNLCECYLEWIKYEACVQSVDYSEVAEEAAVIIERYSIAHYRNNITGTAHFTMAITTAIKSSEGTIKGIVASYGLWVEAEQIADQIFSCPECKIE